MFLKVSLLEFSSLLCSWLGSLCTLFLCLSGIQSTPQSPLVDTPEHIVHVYQTPYWRKFSRLSLFVEDLLIY